MEQGREDVADGKGKGDKQERTGRSQEGQDTRRIKRKRGARGTGGDSATV